MLGKEVTSTKWILRFSSRKAQQFYWLNVIVKALIVLNFIDSIFTLIWVRTGIAQEANILLKNLVNENAVIFMFVKIALVSLGSLLLWRCRRSLFAIGSLFLVFMIYLFLFFYHLQFLIILISA
jgi:hypothetical protein